MKARACLASIAAALLAGCATVLDGTTQRVAVKSVPEGAACTVEREGERIATIAATPGTFEVGKSRGFIRVTCKLPGHLESVVTMVTHVNSSTLWNHAGFGIIGLGVDAASGAMYGYMPEVTVFLLDEVFASEASRDATFYALARITEVEARGHRMRAQRDCPFDCTARMKAFDEALAARLADIEQRRLAAPVRR